MFHARVSTSRLAVLALVTALAVPGGLVSAAGETMHRECEREGHSCATPMIVSCCCHAGPSDQSSPAPLPLGRAELAAPTVMPSALPAFWAVPPTADTFSLAALRLHSPPHPHYSGDLSILFSTFLI
jgi:hypothetical protein